MPKPNVYGAAYRSWTLKPEIFTIPAIVPSSQSGKRRLLTENGGQPKDEVHIDSHRSENVAQAEEPKGYEWGYRWMGLHVSIILPKSAPTATQLPTILQRNGKSGRIMEPPPVPGHISNVNVAKDRVRRKRASKKLLLAMPHVHGTSDETRPQTPARNTDNEIFHAEGHHGESKTSVPGPMAVETCTALVPYRANPFSQHIQQFDSIQFIHGIPSMPDTIQRTSASLWLAPSFNAAEDSPSWVQSSPRALVLRQDPIQVEKMAARSKSGVRHDRYHEIDAESTDARVNDATEAAIAVSRI
jgi:hypothetical protein